MVPNLQHTKTIHCLTSIKDLQPQNEVHRKGIENNHAD